ncbi:uncharacterized protein N7479_004199 [Penicillium vulpinum]|uniref:Uncharacterized protein n=1 Tax=Penicillium vulpinum TaxID=29845 RepID=A0A1V6SD23_9EURO|nr:uncharacterized protein N7479_004199 [Penicillium vulpinum]KAJ5964323.1 hypothetical protein N7479_004199 [Penicillium vulpinum]OQE11604.1 hypothetical protein PENVUL_c002G08719 [Penicillium vulpinum]
MSLINDDGCDLASDIDGMIQVVSDEHSATSLILANLVARRMREFQDNGDDFTGPDTAPPDLLESLSSENIDDVSHESLQDIAYSMDLTTMPNDLLLLVLSMLLHVDTRLPIPEDLHALHEFAEASLMHRKHVETWLRSEPAQGTLEQVFKPWMNYYGFKPAYQCREDIAAYKASRGGAGFNYGYEFVKECQCTSCLALLGNLGLVDYRNYDQNGRSFFHAVIEGGDAESVMFIVAILLEGGLDPRHFPTSIDGMSIPHHVALMHDNDIFRGVVEFLEEAGYPLSVWNDDGLKLELCSFITAEMAEQLLSKGFNITKLPRNTLPMYLPEQNDESSSDEELNRDAEYGDPIIRDEEFDPENDTLDPASIQYDPVGINPIELDPTSRTIWHRAIENPEGPRILDWLLDHSYTQPGCRNNFDRDSGETALVAGARGDEPAGIDWFCQHCDPMAGRVRNSQDTEADESIGAYALQVAAHNLRPNCDIIFKKLLRHVNAQFYWDVSIVKGLYWLIIKNYRDMYQRLEDHSEPGRERAQQMALLRALTSSKTRALNTRLEPFWDTWGPSEQRNWLIQYCTILRLNFLVKDLCADD